MLDINLIRKQPEIIKKDLEKRGNLVKLAWLDDIRKSDKKWRELREEADKLKHKRNLLTEEIAKLKKQGKDISKKIEEMEVIPDQIKAMDEEISVLEEKINYILMRLPNILHKSVPKGKNDAENVPIRKSGTPKKYNYDLKVHGELIEDLGLGDFSRAAKVAGAGFYYILGDLVLLNQALLQFALDFLVKKGYVPIEPPLMMRRKPYEGVTDLEDFKTMMFKIDGEDLYLIATSEHPIAAMFMNEVIDEKQLPLKFAGISACFRKEAGTHGVDTKGLFRTHQFNKIEQFIFCRPEDSWKLHEELIRNAEALFKRLQIPHRVVNVCTGDIGTVAAKKYDLETWSPRQNKYVEVVSCSNCTDYQARRLNIKCGKVGGDKRILHTLNSTAIATSRALVAILENNQQKDGSVLVPKALWPYMNKKVIKGKKSK